MEAIRLDEAKKTEIFHGLWYAIHKLSAQATTPEKRLAFQLFVKELADNNLPCLDCCAHTRQYLHENPLERELDYFVWGVRFHNNVNYRTGKPEFSYDLAREMYVDGGLSCQSCQDKGGSNVLRANIGKFSRS
jgi:hypothetical protein